MQADNEQAQRTEHASRGVSDPARMSPAAFPVCVQSLAVPVPGRGQLWCHTGRAQPGLQLPHGSAPAGSPKPWSSPMESSVQGQCSSAPGTGTEPLCHCFGPRATLTEGGKQQLPGFPGIGWTRNCSHHARARLWVRTETACP